MSVRFQDSKKESTYSAPHRGESLDPSPPAGRRPARCAGAFAIDHDVRNVDMAGTDVDRSGYIVAPGPGKVDPALYSSALLSVAGIGSHPPLAGNLVGLVYYRYVFVFVFRSLPFGASVFSSAGSLAFFGHRRRRFDNYRRRPDTANRRYLFGAFPTCLLRRGKRTGDGVFFNAYET